MELEKSLDFLDNTLDLDLDSEGFDSSFDEGFREGNLYSQSDIENSKEAYEKVKSDHLKYSLLLKSVDDFAKQKSKDNFLKSQKMIEDFRERTMSDSEYSQQKINDIENLIRNIKMIAEPTFREVLTLANRVSVKTERGVSSILNKTKRVDDGQKIGEECKNDVLKFLEEKLKIARIDIRRSDDSESKYEPKVNSVERVVSYEEIEKCEVVYVTPSFTKILSSKGEDCLVRIKCYKMFSPTGKDISKYDDTVEFTIDIENESFKMSSIKIVNEDILNRYKINLKSAFKGLSEEEFDQIVESESIIHKPFFYILDKVMVIFEDLEAYDSFYSIADKRVEALSSSTNHLNKNIFYCRVNLAAEDMPHIFNYEQKPMDTVFKMFTNEELMNLVKYKKVLRSVENDMGEGSPMIKGLIYRTLNETGKNSLEEAFRTDKIGFCRNYIKNCFEIISASNMTMSNEDRVYFSENISPIMKLFSTTPTEKMVKDFIYGNEYFNCNEIDMYDIAHGSKVLGNSKADRENYMEGINKTYMKLSNLRFDKIVEVESESISNDSFKGHYIKDLIYFYMNKKLRRFGSVINMDNPDFSKKILEFFSSLGFNVEKGEFTKVKEITSNYQNSSSSEERILNALSIPKKSDKFSIVVEQSEGIEYDEYKLSSPYNIISLLSEVSSGSILEATLIVSIIDRAIDTNFASKVDSGMDVSRLLKFFRMEMENLENYNSFIADNQNAKEIVENCINAILKISGLDDKLSDVIKFNIDKGFGEGVKSTAEYKIKNDLIGYEFDMNSEDIKEILKLRSSIERNKLLYPLIENDEKMDMNYKSSIETLKQKLVKKQSSDDKEKQKQFNTKYKAFLKTGNAEYLKDIDRNLVDFELLTSVAVGDGDVNGEFSYPILEEEYSLSEMRNKFMDDGEFDYTSFILYLESIDDSFYDSLPTSIINKINSTKIKISQQVLEMAPSIKTGSKFNLEYETI